MNAKPMKDELEQAWRHDNPALPNAAPIFVGMFRQTILVPARRSASLVQLNAHDRGKLFRLVQRGEDRLLAAGLEWMVSRTMNLQKIIGELHHRKDTITRMIQALERLQNAADDAATVAASKRRGRKSMGEAERRAVAERMRRYWAKRRRSALNLSRPQK